MNEPALFRRYRELQSYVGWTDADARRVRSMARLLEPHFTAMIEDFYAEVERHPEAARVITGGTQQIERLKSALRAWLAELVAGRYDEAYVTRRSRTGWRHVEIGLDQVYTNVALSRLRTGLGRALREAWPSDPDGLVESLQSLNKLLDLDLAIIEDAYQSEYMLRRQRSERLAAIGQVSGGLAHELRNPLNVIKTSVYYLLNVRNAPPEKTEQHLKRIEHQIGLADGVITTLSNFARMPLPNLQPVSVAECVRSVLEINRVPGQITVQVDCPASLPPMLADADQIRIALGNLIRNACDAMPDGGRLTITGRHIGNHLELDVTDNGVGITPENLSRIMDPLFSTKVRGLGLGLSIARSILEKNRGTLRVASEVGRGTTFTVHFVAAERDEAE